ncbi:CvpA family protein [Chloroflexota bacterium]
MSWLIDLLVIIILVLSFIGGMKEGAIKSFFSLLALIIAIPLTGLSYHLLAAALSFLPGSNWENLVGFFITMAIISVILQLILLLPRKFLQKIWKKGCLFRLLGGIFKVSDAGIGLTVLTLVLMTYPIFDWLASWVSGSGVLMWLVTKFGFVPAMLPELFQEATRIVTIIAGL